MPTIIATTGIAHKRSSQLLIFHQSVEEFANERRQRKQRTEQQPAGYQTRHNQGYKLHVCHTPLSQALLNISIASPLFSISAVKRSTVQPESCARLYLRQSAVYPLPVT